MKNLLYTFIAVMMAAACTTGSESEHAAIDGPEFVPVEEWSRDANIYEVNIRQYTPEGTFDAFSEHLPRLAEMGVEILWLMPIHPIGVEHRKGGMGSYYSVRDYKDVAPEYGTKEDFRELVDAAHELGMKVIIDWVANHTAWDNVWAEAGHLDWYTLDSSGSMQPPIGTDWWDVADLNYDNEAMRAAMIDAMQFWVEEYDIDGYRCDVAQWVPDEFWVDVRAALDSVKPVFMLAEAEYAKHHTDSAFHMSYGWDLHHRMNQIAKGEKDANHITDYLEGNAKNFPPEAYRMHFTSNHDENSWNGTVYERMGSGAEAFAVLSATLEGMPLIYSGQEAGLDKRLSFFEKDTINWTELPLAEFYTKLLWLNTRNEALWNGIHGGPVTVLSDSPDYYAFTRKKGNDAVLVLLNLSDEAQAVTLTGDAFAGEYDELFTGDVVNVDSGYTEELPAWGYRLYHITTN